MHLGRVAGSRQKLLPPPLFATEHDRLGQLYHQCRMHVSRLTRVGLACSRLCSIPSAATLAKPAAHGCQMVPGSRQRHAKLHKKPKLHKLLPRRPCSSRCSFPCVCPCRLAQPLQPTPWLRPTGRPVWEPRGVTLFLLDVLLVQCDEYM